MAGTDQDQDDNRKRVVSTGGGERIPSAFDCIEPGRDRRKSNEDIASIALRSAAVTFPETVGLLIALEIAKRH